MSEPKEPSCPAGMVPHRDRIKTIADTMSKLKPGQTGAVCIDDTPEHKAFYLHELAKLPNLKIAFQGALTKGIYTIKVERVERGQSN